jgi:hypothetical protein
MNLSRRQCTNNTLIPLENPIKAVTLNLKKYARMDTALRNAFHGQNT